MKRRVARGNLQLTLRGVITQNPSMCDMAMLQPTMGTPRAVHSHLLLTRIRRTRHRGYVGQQSYLPHEALPLYLFSFE